MNNNYIPDSPNMARQYCPGCEPDADPVAEVLDVRWCGDHAPTNEGCDDDSVIARTYLSGTSEVEGHDNRRWCDFFHRAHAVIAAVLFSMLVQPGFLNDETRTLIRSLGRALGCQTPAIAAQWSHDKALMEITVTCLAVGEEPSE